ncbi:helix-turn-helix domain-containing protein, partial [Streptomyces sp. NPDC087850]
MPRTATSAQDAVLSGESSGTLERGLTVVRRLAEAPECRLRPGDLARTTGLARATVDRIVTTLVRLGYLRAESHDVLLAPRLLELGNAYLASNGLPDAVDALALRLADRLDESVSVCVPDRDGARFVTQIPRRRALAISFRTGDLLPAERCAPGALFAADWGEAGWELWRARLRSDSDGTGFPALPARRPARAPGQEADFESRVGRARSAGWALDDQLIEPGLLAVSVPVRGRDGSAVCSVSVISHTSRHTTASLAARALPGLRVCAADMEEAIAAPVTGPAAPVVPSAAPSTAAYLRATKDELGPDFLQSLARGLAVLASLRAPGGLTLSATAEATGLARATARRALLSLRQQGYVAVSPDGQRFTPLPRVLELGYAAQSRLTFDQIVMPHLIGLVRRVHDSATVAVLDGDEIRYAARV